EEALAEWRLRRHLRVEVTGAFIRARGDLAALYRRDLPPAAMREQKAARLRSLADEVLAIERRLGRASGYRGWIDSGLNNAHLAAVATYYDRVPEFERILRERCGGYLPCLYVEARSEARNPRRERPGGGRWPRPAGGSLSGPRRPRASRPLQAASGCSPRARRGRTSP